MKKGREGGEAELKKTSREFHLDDTPQHQDIAK
jgi:hypothetical protein